ncbi:MAG: ABC transporter permease [Armatimonadota bacterium]|nr:ABC transporter permease [Armatimonadota bacterium]MDR7505846.1 ABC transporter permease [Armatimonadota bacterium]MDR7546220.1 ABC transporter permease [Armatimonadota bacterium]MDR7553744.1 ABC transporter permease [Armatimonadota bacterium]MDR7559298.1 ABC transporter permease [Armatimonadota bacterium]
MTARGVWLSLAVTGVYLFLIVPIVIVILAALNAGNYLAFPPQGFSLRWFIRAAETEPFLRSFLFSLKLAGWVTVLSTVLGTMAALYVVRHAARFRDLLRLAIVAPLQFPAILTGIALLIFFLATGIGTRGMRALLIGHTLVSLPYVFLTVSAVLAGFDRSLEEAARSLGAGPLTTFRRITLPLIKGAVISGALFAFITSFDQFPISLLLVSVGNTTLPIQLFDYLRFSFDPAAAAVSTVSVLMSVAIVLIVDRLVGLQAVSWSAPR